MRMLLLMLAAMGILLSALSLGLVVLAAFEKKKHPELTFKQCLERV